MGFKKKIISVTLILLLGVGTLGVANAASVDYHQGPMAEFITTDTEATPAAEVTPDLMNQMLENCRQASQAMIDMWAGASGLSQDEILEMERNWMHRVMQRNPNLDTQNAVQMHHAWINNKLANYKATDVQASEQVQQPNANQETPQARAHHGLHHGWSNGHCWQ